MVKGFDFDADFRQRRARRPLCSRDCFLLDSVAPGFSVSGLVSLDTELLPQFRVSGLVSLDTELLPQFRV